MISPYPNAKIDTEKEKDPYHKVHRIQKSLMLIGLSENLMSG